MLLFVLAILFVVAYLRYYITPSRVPQIIQCHLANCTPELLREKNPIVFQERLVDPTDLPSTVFRCQHIWTHKPDPVAPKSTHKTTARFTVYHCGNAHASHIDVAHPRSMSSSPVRVIMRLGTTVVVPPGWRVTCGSGVQRQELDDAFTAIRRIAVR